MNEIETIKFILQNSSEPVIKNPAIRAALQEPRNMAHGGRIGYAKAKLVGIAGSAGSAANAKKAQNTFYDTYGKEAIDKASKEKHGVTFDKLKGDHKRSNFKIKFIREFETSGTFMTEEASRKFSRQKRVLREQGLQIKLIEATNKPGKFDAAKFAKNNNISMKELKNTARLLQNNMYDKAALITGTMSKDSRSVLEWVPTEDIKRDTTLSKLSKSGLTDYVDNRINAKFYDAFAREKIKGTNIKNPTQDLEKYRAIRKNKNEYESLRRLINKKYPSLNFQLDHPLSQRSINALMEGTAEELSRVNVLDQELNQNFKKQLSDRYFEATKKGEVNLEMKKSVEKIAKDLNINIGSVPDDLNVKGVKRGVQSFEKLNIKDEILKSLKNQQNLSTNFKSYLKDNPDVLKKAGFTDTSKLGTKLTKVTDKHIAGVVKIFKDAGIECIKGAGGQCNSIADYQKGYNKAVKEAAEGSGKAIQKVGRFTKLMRTGLGAAKWTGYGLLAEAGFMVPFAIADYSTGESWKRILGNATDYGFGPILGQSEQEEFEAALPKGSFAVEGEKAWELSERLRFLEESKVRPQGRIGMDEARRKKSRENVIRGITEEFSENLQPFLSDTPWAKDQWHDRMWTKAHEEAAAARAQIEKEKQKRIDERTERGIIADRNWQSQVSRAEGGIMNLKKKW